MRILRITAENLASLAGVQTVDFTQEPLRSAGLFSIIGPTGSGKSTLLDALCLALYDDTPRLKLVKGNVEIKGLTQQDSRNLLRRGATSGMAEAAFTGVDGQTWTAQWKVRRARNKAEGTLQTVTMALFRGNLQPGKNEQLEVGGKKTEVLSAIEERIGLTFEQFTRAVLLAQNEFSAFLKARDDDRATILEALTGMEIFRKISRAVYQQTADKFRELQRLRDQMQGQTPLAADARAEAEHQRTQAQATVNAAQLQTEQWKQQLSWHNVLQQQLADLQQAEERHTAACQADQQAESDRRQLQVTSRIQREASSLVQLVAAAGRRLQTAQQQLQEDTAAEAECLESLSSAEQAAANAQQAEQLLLRTYADLQPDINAAVKLDAELLLKQPLLKQADQELQQATLSHTQASMALQQNRSALQQQQAEDERLLTEQQTFAELQPLAAQAEVWLQRLQDLTRSGQQLTIIEDQLRQTEVELQRQQKLAQQQDIEHQADLQKVTQLTDELRQARARLLQLAPDHLDQTERLLQDDQEQLRIFALTLQQLTSHRTGISDTEQKLGKLAAELLADEQRLQQAQQELPVATQRVEAAKQTAELLRNALDDHSERLRAALQQHQPCPVCGSTEHPWHAQATGIGLETLRQAEQTVSELAERERQLRDSKQTLEGAIRVQRQQQTQMQADLQQQTQHMQAAQTELQNLAGKAQAEAILQLPESEWLPAQQQLQNQINEQLKQIREARQQVRRQEGVCHELEQQRESSLLEQQQRQAQRSECDSQLSSLRGQQQTKQQQLEERQLDLQRQEQLLQPLWLQLPQGQSEFTADAAAFCETTRNRWLQLQAVQKALDDNHTQTKILTAQLPALQQTADAAEQLLQQRTREQQSARSAFEELQRQRTLLLNGQAVEEVQREQRQRLEQAEKQRISANAERDRLMQQHATAKTSAVAAKNALVQITREEEQAVAEVDRWMQTFHTETGHAIDQTSLQQQLAVPAETLEAEERRLQTIRDAVTRSETLLDTCRKTIKKHRETAAPENDAAQIQQLLQDQEPLLREHTEQLQTVDFSLRQDDQVRQRHANLALQLEQSEATAGPWLKLNDLIGSADGKKFSLLAQQVTLDLLLQHANLQLRELASRYRLERVAESLNLSVVDQDLGDERRSVHSLSGGETFLASLALALGLASLTSSRVRIESLFIDEGFGSLDEETLEVAMNALAHLQSQGRRVGIITHVERMKDAIPVQIRIQRTAGGASRIVLPQSPSATDST